MQCDVVLQLRLVVEMVPATGEIDEVLVEASGAGGLSSCSVPGAYSSKYQQILRVWSLTKEIFSPSLKRGRRQHISLEHTISQT